MRIYSLWDTLSAWPNLIFYTLYACISYQLTHCDRSIEMLIISNSTDYNHILQMSLIAAYICIGTVCIAFMIFDEILQNAALLHITCYPHYLQHDFS